MPQLLLLLALGISVEDVEEVATLGDLAVSVCVDNLGEILHQAEVCTHGVSETSHLAEFWEEGNLSTSPPILVDEKGLVWLLDFLVVAGLVVLFVGHLSKD